jgi:hypothetical protein
LAEPPRSSASVESLRGRVAGLATTSARWPATCGPIGVGPDHDPHHRLGAAGRMSTRPRPARRRSASSTSDATFAARPSPPRTGTFTSTCGNRVMTDASSASDRPVRCTRSSTLMPVSRPSPVGARSWKIT